MGSRESPLVRPDLSLASSAPLARGDSGRWTRGRRVRSCWCRVPPIVGIIGCPGDVFSVAPRASFEGRDLEVDSPARPALGCRGGLEGLRSCFPVSARSLERFFNLKLSISFHILIIFVLRCLWNSSKTCRAHRRRGAGIGPGESSPTTWMRSPPRAPSPHPAIGRGLAGSFSRSLGSSREGLLHQARRWCPTIIESPP
jgi:hypothetical protein